jgi:predicted S18 family serine protease
MTASSDTDIRELKELILNLEKKVETGFAEVKREIEQIDQRVRTIEIGQVRIEESVRSLETRIDDQKSAIAKIPDLAEKVGELKNWRQIAIIVRG